MNMGLRAAGLAFRFTLTVFIAKYFLLDTLGVTSLLFAAIAMAPMLLGFGLRHRLGRDIVGRPLEEAAARLRDRVALHGIVALLLLPALLVLASDGVLRQLGHGLSAWIVVAVFALAFCELLSWEVQQGLVSLQQPLLASTFMFIRSSAWAPLYVAAAWWLPGLRSVAALLAFWACGCVLGLLFLLRAMRGWPWRAIAARRMDLRWLLGDARHCLLTYCGDLSLLVTQYADRALIGALLGMSEVGIYFFYWSFAAGVHQLIYTAVVQDAVPALVQSAREDAGAFRATLARSMRAILAWAAVLCIGCMLFVSVVVQHLGQPGIALQLHLLPVLLLAMVALACSDLLSMALYARHEDLAVAGTRFVAMAGGLLCTAAGIAAFGLDGAPLGAALNGVCMLVLRAVLVRRSLARGIAGADRPPAAATRADWRSAA